MLAAAEKKKEDHHLPINACGGRLEKGHFFNLLQ